MVQGSFVVSALRKKNEVERKKVNYRQTNMRYVVVVIAILVVFGCEYCFDNASVTINISRHFKYRSSTIWIKQAIQSHNQNLICSTLSMHFLMLLSLLLEEFSSISMVHALSLCFPRCFAFLVISFSALEDSKTHFGLCF